MGHSKKVFFIISGIMTLFFACNAQVKKTAILEMNYSDRENTQWNMTVEDVSAADIILYDYLRDNQPSLFLSKDNYFRQCWGLKNKNQQEIVCYNCFCKEMPNWKKDLIVTLGGGDCYWSAKVNLVTKECFDFSVNSPK
jgi:hypothetical protein